MAYCEPTDLLLGDIPLPAYVSAQDAVNDAADEIDSRIGFVYETPIDMTDPGPVPRPARLLLKRINAHLATGRLILKLAASGEDDRLHAYGWQLIKDAMTSLDMIANGEIVIVGATPINADDEARTTAIIVENLDDESQVEAFYDRIANPNYAFFGFGQIAETMRRGTGSESIVR